MLSSYGEIAGDQNAALEALIGDIRLVQEWKAAEGSVIKHGLEGRVGQEYTTNPVEAAALAFGETPAAIAAIREAHPSYVMPESRLGPSPWTMTRDDFHNEYAGINDALGNAIDKPYEQWTADELRAEERLFEFVPESIGDITGLDNDQLYDRIRQAAQAAGRDVAEEPPALLAGAEAGRTAVEQSRAAAQEAVELDKGTRERAARNNEPVDTAQLARTHLTRDQQRIYDELTATERAATAVGGLEQARTAATAEPRLAGERAGQRVGEAVGQERVLGRQAQAAGQRVETLEPRIGPAGERAQAAAEQQAGVAERFGERVGKRQAAVRDIERQIRNREGRLSWLQDEKLPQTEARLAEGPRQVMPGKYAPPLLAGERLYNALQRMGDDLAAQTQNPWMSGAFWDLMGDVPRTAEALHAKGIYPEYLPGGVDRPTRGAVTMAGSQEQIPWARAPRSAHQKRYGHVPQEVRTVHRELINEIRTVVESRRPARCRTTSAATGTEIIQELVQRGELEPWQADVLVGPYRDRSIDFAEGNGEARIHGVGPRASSRPVGPQPRDRTASTYRRCSTRSSSGGGSRRTPTASSAPTTC